MTARRVRVGIIGAGYWAAANHIPILAGRDDVELVVACRKGQRELGWLKETYGFGHVTESPAEALGYGVDAVVVASPAALHAEHVSAALEAGAHVLCEKPFTLDAKSAWDLVDLADRRDRHLLLAFGWNYSEVVATARGLLKDDGGIGEVEHLLLAMSSGVRELLTAPTDGEGVRSSDLRDEIPFNPDAETWSDPLKAGGGYAQAQLSHALGLALWLTQERGAEVFAMMNGPSSRMDLHDAIAVRFESGATCSLSGASGFPDAVIDPVEDVHRHQLELRIFGTKGQLLLDLERDYLWRHISGKGSRRFDVPARGGIYECSGPPNALIDLALGGSSHNKSPGELGARTVDILDAAYLSASSGDMVLIPPRSTETVASCV